MTESIKKKGRPGRKITTDNYPFIIKYFARDNFQPSADTVLLRAFASEYRHSIFGKPEDINKYISEMERLLKYHIENNSDKEMIERFRQRIASGRRRIAITEDMIKDLHVKVLELPSPDWQRCLNWAKQQRKRAIDKETEAEKRTIKVSTSVFERLNQLKSHLPGETWDELFMNILNQYEAK